MTPRNGTTDILVLGEIASAMVAAECARLVCTASVETDGDGYIALTVRVKPENQPDMDGRLAALELYSRLRYVLDMGQLRALAERYDIPAAKLEALLKPPPEEDEFPHPRTCGIHNEPEPCITCAWLGKPDRGV